MKKQYIELDHPIPSCETNRLIWDDENKKWKFEFIIEVDSNKEIDDPTRTNPLYIYGHIQQLKLVETTTKNSINLEITSLEQLIGLLEDQYQCDLEYRKQWIEKNPDYYEKVMKIEVKNETQIAPVYHIVSIFEQNEDTTVFVAAPQKRRN